MKFWKKRWKNELDEITPDLRDDVKNAPIPETEKTENSGGNTAVLAINRKKIIAIAAAMCALIICAVTLCVCLIKPADKFNGFLITVEINPAVTMSADGNGVVNGVIASNADADIILSDESVCGKIKGRRLEDAVTFYADCAAKLGYIDLEQKGSAVRISGLGNDGLLEKAQASLENYFTGKGVFVVVIAESVGKEEFALRSGISAESYKAAAEFIMNSTPLFSEREAEGLSLKSLQNLYDEFIVADKLFSFVNDSLAENIKRIVKNAEDIQKLSQLYVEILAHADNPMKLLGDYWSVKKLYGSSLGGEFGELMREMDTALNNYKSEYGVEITGKTQLFSAVDSYLKLPAELLENLSLDKFKELSSDIAGILEITGLVTSDFANYLQAPDSFEEYARKTLNIFNSEYRSRLEAYGSLYNKYRPPLESADYENYIESIIDSYGNLSAYWQAVKA